MRGVERNGNEKLTLLELALQLEGDIRRRLEPIRVTPLQAGVLLYLQRHMDAKLTDAAAALRVTQPTLSEVIKDLVGKRWVTKRRSVADTRIVHLRLSPRGLLIIGKIQSFVSQVSLGVAAKKTLTAAGRKPLL